MIIHKYVLGVLETNTYLIETNKKNAVIIDPADNADFLVDKLAEHGLELQKIFITHGHFDHFAACSKLSLLTGAKVYVHEKDALKLTNPYPNAFPVAMEGINVKAIVPDEFYKDGDEISLDEVTLNILDAPGHSEGGVVIFIPPIENRFRERNKGVVKETSKNTPTLFTGDLIFQNTIGNTWGSEENHDSLLKSIKSIISIIQKNYGDNVDIYPGHGPTTTLDYELKFNTYISDLEFA